MNYFLTYPKQEEFIAHLLKDTTSDDEEMQSMLEGCKHFYFSIYGNCYNLSRSIQKKIKSEELENDYVDSVFNLCETNQLFFEHLSSDFINYVIQYNISSAEKELEEEICELHEKFVR